MSGVRASRVHLARLRLVAIAVLAVIALASGGVALALGTREPPPGDPHTAPANPLQDLWLPAGVAASVGHVRHDGLDRSWLTISPPTGVAGLPLLVVLHGRNATPAGEADRDQLLRYVLAGKAVLVYPTGVNQAWNVGDDCCGEAGDLGLDDVGFVGTVVDHVRAQLHLTGPTDLVGFSNGGRLAFQIACSDAARYTAFAMVSAAPTTTTCPDASVPRPLFAAAVLDDTELPTHEEPQPVPDVVADIQRQWTERNGCSGPPTVRDLGTPTSTTWTDCVPGTSVQTVVWPSGGHSWPQDVYIGHPDAGELVWAFLAGADGRTPTV